MAPGPQIYGQHLWKPVNRVIICSGNGYFATSHNLNKYWYTVNWTLLNKFFEFESNPNTNIFFHWYCHLQDVSHLVETSMLSVTIPAQQLHANHSFISIFILTLNVLNCFNDYKRYIHTLNHILDLVWPSRWNYLWNNNICYLSNIPKTMPADALATLGAKASAGMVLNHKAGIFRLQHLKINDISLNLSHESILEWYVKHTSLYQKK